MEDIKNHTTFGRSKDPDGPGGMIECRDLIFSYPHSPFTLSIPALNIDSGEQIAIVGPSGSGKTTFLNMIAGILCPISGRVLIDGIDVFRYGKEDRQDLRIVKMGLIFQEFELLEYLSVYENILLPLRINSLLQIDDAARDRAEVLATLVGLKEKLGRLPAQLSHGERQRVGFCRSIITEPSILLCDEPTANLDKRNRDLLIDSLLGYCIDYGTTLIMVTHDHEVIKTFARIVDITDYT